MSCDILADGRHFAAEFMTDDDGIDSRWEFTVDDVDVGSADATGANLDNDIIRSGLRHWDVDDPHCAGLVDHDRFHYAPPMQALGIRPLDISFQRDSGQRSE
jgi:hypothetical protein